MLRRALLAAALLAAACAPVAPAPAPVELRLIAFNDFHGHLEPPPFGLDLPDEAHPGAKKRVPAGGLAHLAAAIADLKRGHANTAVVAAGDLVGASPLASSFLRDEPSIIGLDAAGLEISSVGNHEFDRGRVELERLQGGGCGPEGSCVDAPFPGARFRYLAANVFDSATRKPFLPPYAIRRYEGVAVAFVGAVLRATPQIVLKSGVADLEFRDEAASVNALVPELEAQGVHAIVLLIHEGGRTRGGYDDPACPGFEGAIVDIVRRLDPAIDIVVSGHTHEAYRCRVGSRLVTSAGAFGRYVTAIDLALDPSSGRVVASKAANLVVDPRRFAAAEPLAAYVRHIAALAREKSGRVVGFVAGEVTSVESASGESALGDLVADSQLAAMEEEGARIAFMNPGGLRAPLAGHGPRNEVTYGDLHSVLPFGNTLVAMTLSGAQILGALEAQWRADPGERRRILQVSAGLQYSWDGRRPIGSRVVPGSVKVSGRPLEPGAAYRVVVNSFLAGGGDGFTVFTEGEEAAGGPIDTAALEAYLRRYVIRATPPRGRILRVDGP